MPKERGTGVSVIHCCSTSCRMEWDPCDVEPGTWPDMSRHCSSFLKVSKKIKVHVKATCYLETVWKYSDHFFTLDCDVQLVNPLVITFFISSIRFTSRHKSCNHWHAPFIVTVMVKGQFLTAWLTSICWYTHRTIDGNGTMMVSTLKHLIPTGSWSCSTSSGLWAIKRQVL